MYLRKKANPSSSFPDKTRVHQALVLLGVAASKPEAVISKRADNLTVKPSSAVTVDTLLRNQRRSRKSQNSVLPSLCTRLVVLSMSSLSRKA